MRQITNYKPKAPHSISLQTTCITFTVALKDSGTVLTPSPVTPLTSSSPPAPPPPTTAGAWAFPQLHSSKAPSPYTTMTSLAILEREVNKMFKRQNTRKAAGLDSFSPSRTSSSPHWRHAMCQPASSPTPSSLSPKKQGSQDLMTTDPSP